MRALLQALEPHISGEIMELHHTKHHQTYVNGLNAAEEAYAKAETPKDRIKLQAALKFNGGGARRVLEAAFVRHLTLSVQGTSTTRSSGRTWPPLLATEASSPTDR